jgi:hypothetical protein
MEYKAKPEYEKCVAISTEASIREMMLPGAIALLTPIIVGFGFKGMFADASSAEMLGGLLAGVTVSGVLMGIFQSNAGGAWDNAKKSFEKGVLINGEMFYKKSEPHKASVTGDTVGDPFKDTSGPSMNILIKLMSIVSLVIAPYIAVQGGLKADKLALMHGEKMECCVMDSMDMEECTMIMGKCEMSKCMEMTKDECALICDSMGCDAKQKEMCLSMYGADGKFNEAKCKAMCEKESACMENCDKGCKTEEECMKSCDKACVTAHKEGKACCDDDKEEQKQTKL